MKADIPRSLAASILVAAVLSNVSPAVAQAPPSPVAPPAASNVPPPPPGAALPGKTPDAVPAPVPSPEDVPRLPLPAPANVPGAGGPPAMDPTASPAEARHGARVEIPATGFPGAGSPPVAVPVAGRPPLVRAHTIIRDTKLRVLQRHYETTLSETVELEKAMRLAPESEREAMAGKLAALHGFSEKLEADIQALAVPPSPADGHPGATPAATAAEPDHEEALLEVERRSILLNAAQRDYERTKQLSDSGVIPGGEELERKEAALKLAEVELRMAMARAKRRDRPAAGGGPRAR